MIIAINLLPKSQRKTDRKVVVPYKIYLAGAAAILILVHVGLAALFVTKKVQVMHLRGVWGRMAPQSKDLKGLREEMMKLQTDIATLTPMVSRPTSVTEMLSTLTNAVPKGLWLDRFSMTPKSLVIQGSVVSMTQNEMTTIGKFLQELKTSKTFESLCTKIDLSSVQRRTIKTYDVVDFVLTGEIKE